MDDHAIGGDLLDLVTHLEQENRRLRLVVAILLGLLTLLTAIGALRLLHGPGKVAQAEQKARPVVTITPRPAARAKPAAATAASPALPTPKPVVAVQPAEPGYLEFAAGQVHLANQALQVLRAAGEIAGRSSRASEREATLSGRPSEAVVQVAVVAAALHRPKPAPPAELADLHKRLAAHYDALAKEADSYLRAMIGGARSSRREAEDRLSALVEAGAALAAELDTKRGTDQPSPPKPTAAPAAPRRVVVREQDGLNLRDEAGTEGTIVGRLDLGTEVEVLGDQGDWLQVKTPDGLEGWAVAKLDGEVSLEPVTP